MGFSMAHSVAQRIEQLPPYLFAEIDRKKQAARARGVDLVDLSIGDPDLPTPDHICRALAEAARDPRYHRYPSYEGMAAFREAAAEWFQQRFAVAVDPETEVLALIGSKEGIGHLPLAYVNPGDVVLVPDPGYPVYTAGTLFAGGVVQRVPLLAKNDFLPELNAIPSDVLARAKLLWLNYPNNPTAAVASKEFLASAAAFARRHDLILCHDAAYAEIADDDAASPSLLQVEGGKETGLEFHSLSKTYNMTGWRIGFAVGDAELIQGLGRIKTNLDSGIFEAVQIAGIEALRSPRQQVQALVAEYRQRRARLVRGLNQLGWQVPMPKATFYVWTPIPTDDSSRQFCARLLDEAGIVITPGVGFGPSGEGYVRFSLTTSPDRIEEALRRLEKLKM